MPPERAVPTRAPRAPRTIRARAGLRPALDIALRWGVLLGLSLGLAAIFGWAGFPAAALLGPVIVATVVGLRGSDLRVTPRLHELTQGVAGCLVAHSVTPEIAVTVLAIWPAVLFFACTTLAMALLVGWMVGRMGRIGPEEAVWGFLPGMAGAVIAMSHQHGLDSRMVAVIQILRLMAVILVMSVVSRLLADPAALPVPGAGHEPGAAIPGNVLLTLAVAGLGPVAARWLRFLPSAAMLLPLIVAATIQASGLAVLPLPGWLLSLAYFVLGVQVGLRFSPAIIRHAIRALPQIIGASLALMALCAASGALLAVVAGTSLLTGMLSTVPGSVETVAIIAINSGADVSFVMTMQVVRLFAVVLAGPVLARWLCARLPAARPAGASAQEP